MLLKLMMVVTACLCVQIVQAVGGGESEATSNLDDAQGTTSVSAGLGVSDESEEVDCHSDIILLDHEDTPHDITTAGKNERSFIMVKPDGVQRGLIGDIIKRFEQKGFKLVAMKFMQPSKELLEKHYADLSSKPFFPGLVNFMATSPVCCMVWEGLGVVATGRQMLGETDPAKSQPGTIRGDFCIHIGRNICHGSDSVASAEKEINLWFEKKELVDWTPTEQQWIYE